METLLGGWGCRVLKATDLTSAIAAMTADATTPDGLLVDYHLDGGNGVMVIAELRRRLLRHHPRDRDHGRPLGHVREEAAREAAHLINKPIKPASLRALMTQWHVQRVAAELAVRLHSSLPGLTRQSTWRARCAVQHGCAGQARA